MRFAPGDAAKVADFGSVLGEQARHNVARVSVPSSCRTSAFTASVSTLGASKVVLSVDGKRRATIARVDPGRRFRFRIVPARYRPGVHHLDVRVSYTDGSETVAKATFYRCRAARPSFAG
jgi:hypothetical protein